MRSLKLTLFLLLSIGTMVLMPAFTARSAGDDDVLTRSRATYAALNSYADKGTVVNEFGPANGAVTEKHNFTTYFRRAPRGFYFEFNKASGDRFVIWGDPYAFHTWWKTIGTKTDYPNPSNTGAFVTAEPNTLGAALKIPALLYKGALAGAFSHFTDAVNDGTEDISGHKCYRVVGTAKDVYSATGRETNIRQMTVWIDAESLLIRKVVEVPKDIPAGYLNRVTTTFEPQANPTLEDSRFGFTPPSSQP